MMTKAEDTEFQDHVLDKVEEHADGWSIGFGGYGLGIPKVAGITPRVGSAARLYGKGFGGITRGVDIDGRQVYYRTPQEQDTENRRQAAISRAERRESYEKARPELEREYAALPEVFRRRLDHFRRNPDFGWQYEGYEMSVCTTAVCIAEACRRPEFRTRLRAEGIRTKDGAWPDTEVGALQAYAAINSDVNGYNYKLQHEVLPEVSDGHSGNSFGCALRLAHHYLTNPENVYREHGAMVMLVGCEAYGCEHPR